MYTHALKDFIDYELLHSHIDLNFKSQSKYINDWLIVLSAIISEWNFQHKVIK
jgi:hypothetical protein